MELSLILLCQGVRQLTGKPTVWSFQAFAQSIEITSLLDDVAEQS